MTSPTTAASTTTYAFESRVNDQPRIETASTDQAVTRTPRGG